MATSVKINDEIKDRIRQLAEAKNRSAHWIMCEAIKEYLEREEKKENFKQEALASWKTFQETGKHLTGQEIRDWLKTWGTDKEDGAPSCHD